MCISTHIFKFREIEYLDEDESLLSNQLFGWSHETSENERVSNEVSGSSQILNEVESVANEICSHIASTSNPAQGIAICNKCVQLEVELQKAKLVVLKLKKRCTDKVSEIKRLKAAEKRSRLAKCTLEDMLQEMKQKKWITDEGEDVLNVNKSLL